MAKLIYAALTSLDGYVADEQGKFDWAEPDEEVHRFVNDLERPLGTHLYGRRMYDVMRAWETMDVADEPQVIQDYAEIWRGTDKLVFSRTLDAVSTAKTTLEREFDAEAVWRLKAGADRDLAVGGPGLAAEALGARLVDELHLLVAPKIVGGGTQSLPDAVEIELELLDQRRFGNGVVYLRYRIR